MAYSADKTVLEQLEELSRIEYMFQDDAPKEVFLQRLKCLEAALERKFHQTSTLLMDAKSKLQAAMQQLAKLEGERREKQNALDDRLAVMKAEFEKKVQAEEKLWFGETTE